jgi:hypothetical protein
VWHVNPSCTKQNNWNIQSASCTGWRDRYSIRLHYYSACRPSATKRWHATSRHDGDAGGGAHRLGRQRKNLFIIVHWGIVIVVRPGIRRYRQDIIILVVIVVIVQTTAPGHGTARAQIAHRFLLLVVVAAVAPIVSAEWVVSSSGETCGKTCAVKIKDCGVEVICWPLFSGPTGRRTKMWVLTDKKISSTRTIHTTQLSSSSPWFRSARKLQQTHHQHNQQ